MQNVKIFTFEEVERFNDFVKANNDVSEILFQDGKIITKYDLPERMQDELIRRHENDVEKNLRELMADLVWQDILEDQLDRVRNRKAKQDEIMRQMTLNRGSINDRKAHIASLKKTIKELRAGKYDDVINNIDENYAEESTNNQEEGNTEENNQ